MRRYQKWLATLGLVTITPGTTWAGPFSQPKPNQVPIHKVASQNPQGPFGGAISGNSARPAPPPRSNQNQQVAESIGRALRQANLTGCDIGIEFKNGVAILVGQVSNPSQRAAAYQIASAAPGVKKVENRLAVAGQPQRQAAPPVASGIQQASYNPRIIQAGGQEGVVVDPPAPAEVPMSGMPMEAMEGMPVGPGGHPSNPPPFVPGNAPAPPGYGGPMGGGSHQVYDQPGFPNHAWPSYAQYPNYAAVNYPKQYSASAWPYIGPFYPYPQVPLGWRAAQLEWDDGFWQLNFRPRTDRWWWFMDYRNW